MTLIEFVDIATARTAPGVRIVVSGLVPNPWSEATKGLFRIANVPVRAVRRTSDAAEVTAWTGVDNAPVVFHDAEPARTSWAAITALAARLAGPGVVIPEELDARVQTMGLLHEIAGEDGLAWNARLQMIDASITSEGKRSFSLPVGQYLARRYGYTPDAAARGRARAERQLHLLRDRLRAQQALGHAYLGGSRVSALDVYLATFLTPLSPIAPEDCPQLEPALRQAIGTAHEALGGAGPRRAPDAPLDDLRAPPPLADRSVIARRGVRASHGDRGRTSGCLRRAARALPSARSGRPAASSCSAGGCRCARSTFAAASRCP
jgi:glutathione S-transferase